MLEGVAVTSRTACGHMIIYQLTTEVSRNRSAVCHQKSLQQLGCRDGSNPHYMMPTGLTVSIRTVPSIPKVCGRRPLPLDHLIHELLTFYARCYTKRMKNTSRSRECSQDSLLDIEDIIHGSYRRLR